VWVNRCMEYKLPHDALHVLAAADQNTPSTCSCCLASPQAARQQKSEGRWTQCWEWSNPTARGYLYTTIGLVERHTSLYSTSRVARACGFLMQARPGLLAGVLRPLVGHRAISHYHERNACLLSNISITIAGYLLYHALRHQSNARSQVTAYPALRALRTLNIPAGEPSSVLRY